MCTETYRLCGLFVIVIMLLDLMKIIIVIVTMLLNLTKLRLSIFTPVSRLDSFQLAEQEAYTVQDIEQEV